MENAAMKSHRLLILLIVGIALFAPPAWAQEETTAANTIEIGKLTCKQLMAGNDLERDVVIAYYHGLMDGKKKVEVLDIPEAFGHKRRGQRLLFVEPVQYRDASLRKIP